MKLLNKDNGICPYEDSDSSELRLNNEEFKGVRICTIMFNLRDNLAGI